MFKRMDTLVSYLKDVGISQFDVDAADYAPETAPRPDRAAALRRTHEAAEYDKWFRQQIEEAIREADDPNTVWKRWRANGQSCWRGLRARPSEARLACES
ncbi:hypothetical protein JOH50_005202 [Rhizobium leguminosarum]|nr:hypothetical protein [Rhizobium leguminosarum]